MCWIRIEIWFFIIIDMLSVKVEVVLVLKERIIGGGVGDF